MQRHEFWNHVREQVIGRNAPTTTPFGRRMMTYADFTASGRGVRFIEHYIGRVLRHYGNTHTEDDATGRITTRWLRQAEKTIKRLLGATDAYKLIEVGAGTTAAVHRLQQILGIYLPPAAKADFSDQVAAILGDAEARRLASELAARRPVVFVGPYEHHSNEVSWRECWADVVEIGLTDDGLIDLDDLDRKVGDAVYRDRRRIGAFSAASNVSGVKTPVHDVARILHRHGALAFFDYAAIAPYVSINVHQDDESYFDAVYFSPHKFLGGPGSSGFLLIHEGLYREDLPPTVGAGGTVNFVDFTGQQYDPDIETREKPGTPGIIQTMRGALVMELVERLGPEAIASREDELLGHALKVMGEHESIEILGPQDPARRIAIVSFNIRESSSYLHPRFVTLLLNDLFGIQSRAGCSCAGPYGHRMLHLNEVQSATLRDRINHGVLGLRPGWVRVNFHYLLTDEEACFLLDAIRFVADNGRYFLPLYRFDVRTGSWEFRGEEKQVVDLVDQRAPKGSHADSQDLPPEPETFGLEEALCCACDDTACCDAVMARRAYLDEAARLAGELRSRYPKLHLHSTSKDLIPFVYV
jgi:selenocysteine lyase/cysteine desulfurase